jgi:hypothetical protein
MPNPGLCLRRTGSQQSSSETLAASTLSRLERPNWGAAREDRLASNIRWRRGSPSLCANSPKFRGGAVNKKREKVRDEVLAPRHGFEPRFTAPKAAVLPLDDRGIGKLFSSVASRPLQPQCDLSKHPRLLHLPLEANLGRCWARASNPLCGVKPRVGSTPTGFRQNLHTACHAPRLAASSRRMPRSQRS